MEEGDKSEGGEGKEKPEEASSAEPSERQPEELIEFTVVHNKAKYQVKFDLNKTVSLLKAHLETVTGVPVTLQKVVYKGMVRDEKTLRESGLTAGCRLMVVGSKLDDVLAVSATPPVALVDDKPSTTKEPLCRQKMHRKVIERGVPEDVLPGILNMKEPLPPYPLCGMVNKAGGKVRLTFKLEMDQLWIGTKDRTEKIPMSSIKNIVSEPIDGHLQYHIMGLQLGSTEASNYWVYWVPAQYIDSIKDAVLGQCFI